MRISDSTRYDALLRSMGAAQAEQYKATQKASSGSRINAPSDDPIGAAEAVRIQASIEQTNNYRSAIGKVRGDVSLAESSLAQATELMTRAREIALRGASGSTTAVERASLANEIQGLRDQLLVSANQKGSFGFLFGGTATQTQPFDADGNFLGNDEQRTLEIAPGVSTITSASGAKAFTAEGGRDVFADLRVLEDALNANDSASIQSSVSFLDSGMRQIVAARVDAGIKVGRLEAADSAHQQTQVSLASTQHNVVDADTAAAYSDLARTQQALEVSYTVSRQILDTMTRNPLS